MAPNSDDRPPQTLRQAKAAYRKSSRTPQLSEKEQRIIKRRAELEERAAKLREKEKRRLENKKKREEKAKAEKPAPTKRAGSATIGGTVVNKQSERCDLLEKFVNRKRTCSEALSEGHEEKSGLCKAVKLGLEEPVASPSKVVEPTGKENAVPKQLDTASHTPRTSQKTLSVLKQPDSTPRAPRGSQKTPSVPKQLDTTSCAPRTSPTTPSVPKQLDGTPRAPRASQSGPSVPKQQDTTSYGPRKSQKTPSVLENLDTTSYAPRTSQKTPSVPKKLDTTSYAPRTSQKTPAASHTITTTKALTPRNPNIVTSPTVRPQSAVFTTKPYDVLCMDDWQDAVISSSQLEREMLNPTQPPPKPVPTVTGDGPIPAPPKSHSPKLLVQPDGPMEDEQSLIISTQDWELTSQDLEEIVGPVCPSGNSDVPNARDSRIADVVCQSAAKGGVASVKTLDVRRGQGSDSRGVETSAQLGGDPPSSYGSSWIDDELLLQIPLDENPRRA
ncbi:MAG: hypothetical protein M1823_003331 [Watsoniomyces obsoletus]|nr:MAG: hypothetical protein M1823_003331 [Watsoniomyces obsoletus]